MPIGVGYSYWGGGRLDGGRRAHVLTLSNMNLLRYGMYPWLDTGPSSSSLKCSSRATGSWGIFITVQRLWDSTCNAKQSVTQVRRGAYHSQSEQQLSTQFITKDQQNRGADFPYKTVYRTKQFKRRKDLSTVPKKTTICYLK